MCMQDWLGFTKLKILIQGNKEDWVRNWVKWSEDILQLQIDHSKQRASCTTLRRRSLKTIPLGFLSFSVIQSLLMVTYGLKSVWKTKNTDWYS